MSVFLCLLWSDLFISRDFTFASTNPTKLYRSKPGFNLLVGDRSSWMKIIELVLEQKVAFSIPFPLATDWHWQQPLAVTPDFCSHVTGAGRGGCAADTQLPDTPVSGGRFQFLLIQRNWALSHLFLLIASETNGSRFWVKRSSLSLLMCNIYSLPSSWCSCENVIQIMLFPKVLTLAYTVRYDLAPRLSLWSHLLHHSSFFLWPQTE